MKKHISNSSSVRVNDTTKIPHTRVPSANLVNPRDFVLEAVPVRRWEERTEFRSSELSNGVFIEQSDYSNTLLQQQQKYNTKRKISTWQEVRFLCHEFRSPNPSDQFGFPRFNPLRKTIVHSPPDTLCRRIVEVSCDNHRETREPKWHRRSKCTTRFLRRWRQLSNEYARKWI